MIRSRSLLLLLLFALGVVLYPFVHQTIRQAALPAQADIKNQAQPHMGPIDIRQLMDYAHIPGLALVKVEHGKVVYMQAYGLADEASATPLTTDTLFNIASISKPMLGILLLKAEQQELLSLDEDVNRYLPFAVVNPNFPDAKITLREIATHTSSIADYFNFDFYCFNQDCAISLEQYLFRLLSKDGDLYEAGSHYLAKAPGSHWQYSNLATALAGLILERQTGKTLDELSQQLIFTELLAAPASWKLEPVKSFPLATQYEVQGCLIYGVCFDPQAAQPWRRQLSNFLTAHSAVIHYRAYPAFGNPQYPDGGLRTSIQGLGNLMVNLLANRTTEGGQILSPEIYREMFRVQVPDAVQKGQRFFWRQNDGALMSDDYIGHIGADYGLFTALYFNPATKDGFAVLMNRGIDDLSWQAMASLTAAYKANRL